MISPPPPELVERFRRDLERLTGPAPGRIGIAVSGGPDSLALLLLAEAVSPGQVLAATVDHGLRQESAAEARMVASICHDLSLPHIALEVEVPPGSSGNLHAWARQERYALLGRWALNAGVALCTAHHAEDQAETFLMRAARASGLAGLAAVRAERDEEVALRELTRIEPRPDGGAVICVTRGSIRILRPLLRWRRAELRAIVEGCGLPFVDDPSNEDERFTRRRFRRWLAQAPWIDPVQIGRSAENLADADADMRAISHWLWEERARPGSPDDAIFDVTGLPRGVRRYLTRMAVDHVTIMAGIGRGGPDRVGNVEAMLDALEAGSGATLAGVQASARGTLWHFHEAPPRRTG